MLKNIQRNTDSKSRAFVKLFLKKMGLISLAKTTRFRLWQLYDNKNRSAYLKRTVKDIKNNVKYSDTPDSRDKLAHDIAGDNLIVIARKS